MGKEIQPITDYKDFKSFLLSQFQTKERFLGIFNAFSNEMNDLETALFEIRDLFYMDTAVGVQLDIIGRVLDLARNGRTDDSYRALLQVKAALNFNAGTPESLITTAVKFFNATVVQYIPAYPAGVNLWTDGDIGLTIRQLMELDDTGLLELDDGGILEVEEPDALSEDILFEILPAGVSLNLLGSLTLDDSGFLELDDGGTMLVTI